MKASDVKRHTTIVGSGMDTHIEECILVSDFEAYVKQAEARLARMRQALQDAYDEMRGHGWYCETAMAAALFNEEDKNG